MFSMFQDAAGFLIQRSGGCTSLKAAIPRWCSDHLVLDLPRLPPPSQPITKSSVLQSSSHFIPYHPKIHIYVISHCQYSHVLSPLLTLCTGYLCCWPCSSCTELTFKNCGVTRRTVATRQICSSVADLKARAIADSKPLQEGVGTRNNQTIYLRRGGRRAFFSCLDRYGDWWNPSNKLLPTGWCHADPRWCYLKHDPLGSSCNHLLVVCRGAL